VLPWDESKPRGQVLAGFELGAIADGGYQCRRGNNADTWDGRQVLARVL